MPAPTPRPRRGPSCSILPVSSSPPFRVILFSPSLPCPRFSLPRSQPYLHVARRQLRLRILDPPPALPEDPAQDLDVPLRQPGPVQNLPHRNHDALGVFLPDERRLDQKALDV